MKLCSSVVRFYIKIVREVKIMLDLELILIILEVPVCISLMFLAGTGFSIFKSSVLNELYCIYNYDYVVKGVCIKRRHWQPVWKYYADGEARYWSPMCWMFSTGSESCAVQNIYVVEETDSAAIKTTLRAKVTACLISIGMIVPFLIYFVILFSEYCTLCSLA